LLAKVLEVPEPVINKSGMKQDLDQSYLALFSGAVIAIAKRYEVQPLSHFVTRRTKYLSAGAIRKNIEKFKI